jgi:hypothetical protein
LKLDNLLNNKKIKFSKFSENILNFKEGSSIKGNITKILNDKVIINIKGEFIEAKVNDINQDDLGKTIDFNVESIEDGIIKLKKKSDNNIKEISKYVLSDFNDSDISKDNNKILINNAKNSKIINVLKENGIEISPEILDKLNEILSSSKVLDLEKAVFFAINNVENSEKNINTLLDIVDNKFDLSETFDDIKLDFDNIDNKDLKEKLNTIFKKNFIIDPKINLNKEELNKIYNEINKNIDAIKNFVENQEFSNKDSLMNKIEMIQNTLSFLDDLTDINSYIQIPLKIFDKKSKGELFVLKRDKNKKKIDPKDVSMVISLDTENIGVVDSIINVKNKNISVNMAVSEKKVVNAFKKGQQKLYKMLNSKGYNLVDFKCKLKSEEINLVNFERIVRTENNKNIKNKIDYRL